MVVQLIAGQPRNLAYSEAIRKDIKLLEVDEGLLEELLDTGLCLKGAPGEEAVLCSTSKTFAIKTVETTNLVLLVSEDQAAAVEASVEALGSQDANVPQPTPPGVLLGLGTQLQKNQSAAQRAPVMASAVVSSHLELVPAAPRLRQLDALLQEHQFGAEGSDEEEQDPQGGGMQADEPSSSGGYGAEIVDGSRPGNRDSGGRTGQNKGSRGWARGYTEEELLMRVQCSAAELKVALRDRRTLCLDGRYCSVDESYQGMLLELVLLTAVEHGWPLSALPGLRVAAALEPHGYDPRVTLHCLDTYGSPVGSDSGTSGSGEALPSCNSASETAAESDTGVADMEVEEVQETALGAAGGSAGTAGGCYALDEALVCLHFARSLLQAQPDWELTAFEHDWQGRVPEGMLPSLEMLRGEARVYGGGTGAAGLPQPPRIKHFPLRSLPQDAAARFAALFAEKTRWEWEELAPYVQGLQSPGQTAEALLLKYARASQQRPTDPVTYSAR